MDTVTTLRRSDGLTRADLDAMPDDGCRHELIDGVIVMSPAPNDRHQQIVLHLAVLLQTERPPHLRIRTAPYDVTLAERSILQPDVLVARADDIAASGLPAAPLLAIEVLSPSTRQVDLLLKRERYQRAGCPSYWVVDPGFGSSPPTLVAWELAESRATASRATERAYVEVACVTGTASWHAERPFPVTVTPAELLDGP